MTAHKLAILICICENYLDSSLSVIVNEQAKLQRWWRFWFRKYTCRAWVGSDESGFTAFGGRLRAERPHMQGHRPLGPCAAGLQSPRAACEAEPQ